MLNAPRAIQVYAIYVQEINPKAGEDLIEWMLLTNLSTLDFETALIRIRWYKYRWLIEICQSYCLHKNKVIVNEPFLPANDKSIAWVFPSMKRAA
ncbi:MAG: hypothetical protein JSR33_08705 [Proteobacteria bacterium]|nr:hypothetical protein [Pseudomonadota bacterium]